MTITIAGRLRDIEIRTLATRAAVQTALTTALLDRLSHHAHILTTRGDSFRSQRTIRAAGGAKKDTPNDDSEAR